MNTSNMDEKKVMAVSLVDKDEHARLIGEKSKMLLVDWFVILKYMRINFSEDAQLCSKF